LNRRRQRSSQPVPGAIGAFRREALLRVGGVSDDTLAEDTDLTMALCRDGWRVVYKDDARAWTNAPASLSALWKQRYRWFYGTLQAMWKHRGAVVQGGAAGKLGRRGLGYLLVLQVLLLPLFAPVVDVFAVYGLIFLDPFRIVALWFVFLAVQFLMAACAFRLDNERLRPLWTLPLQQFVYRQLMYLDVIQAVVTALAGVHLRWHRMERYGSLRVPPAQSRLKVAASAGRRRSGAPRQSGAVGRFLPANRKTEHIEVDGLFPARGAGSDQVKFPLTGDADRARARTMVCRRTGRQSWGKLVGRVLATFDHRSCCRALSGKSKSTPY
jgi:hypothetical protein